MIVVHCTESAAEIQVGVDTIRAQWTLQIGWFNSSECDTL